MKSLYVLAAMLAAMFPVAHASAAPESSALAFARQMSPGWNLGNTLEAIGSGAKPATRSQETAWGNPAASAALMRAVYAAGFRSIRIPVAWNQYADAHDTIGSTWLDRVAEVVAFARSAGLTVMINVHWDGGWLQPTYADQVHANARLARFWTQIATRFRDADDHLLFAGTNEVMVTGVYSAPTAENCAVQNGFNQLFVDAVRATGGNNATRYLVVQGYNTNIDHTTACNGRMPRDSAAGRLMMEVHYYDPYDFTLNTSSNLWQWGAGATIRSATANWGDEVHADAQFQKMKIHFVDRGVPVLLGEYAASLRSEHDPRGVYRDAWNAYVTRSACRHGLVPIYWDNGIVANHNSGLFDRRSSSAAHPESVRAIVEAAARCGAPE